MKQIDVSKLAEGFRAFGAALAIDSRKTVEQLATALTSRVNVATGAKR